MKKTVQQVLSYVLVLMFLLATISTNQAFAAGVTGQLIAGITLEGQDTRVAGVKLTYTDNGKKAEAYTNGVGRIRLRRVNQLGKEFTLELPKSLNLKQLRKSDVQVVISKSMTDFANQVSLRHDMATALSGANGGKVTVTLKEGLKQGDSIFLSLILKKSVFEKNGEMMTGVNLYDGSRVKFAKVNYSANGQSIQAKTNAVGRLRVRNVAQFGKEVVVELPADLKLERLSAEDVAVVVADNLDSFGAEKSLAHKVTTVFDKKGSKVIVTLDKELQKGDDLFLAVTLKENAFAKYGELMTAVEVESGERIRNAAVSYTANGQEATGTTNVQGRFRVKEVARFGNRFVITLPADLQLEKLDREDVHVLTATQPENLVNDKGLEHTVETVFGAEGNKVIVTLSEELPAGESAFVFVQVKSSAWEKAQSEEPKEEEKEVSGELIFATERENNVRIAGAEVRSVLRGEEQTDTTNAAGRVRKQVKEFADKYVVELPADLGLQRLRREDVYVAVSNGPENYETLSRLVEDVEVTFQDGKGKVEVTVVEEALKSDQLFVQVVVKDSAFAADKPSELVVAVQSESTGRISDAKVTYFADSNAMTDATSRNGRLRVKEVQGLGDKFVIEFPATFERLNKEEVMVSVFSNGRQVANYSEVTEATVTIELTEKMIAGESVVVSVVLK